MISLLLLVVRFSLLLLSPSRRVVGSCSTAWRWEFTENNNNNPTRAMNTINCRIKVNDFQDVAGREVTPAEVILLRTLHDKQAGGCCIKLAVPAGVAMTEIGRKRVKKKMTDSDGNEIEIDTSEPKLRERTDEEEIARLRQKYQARAKSGAPGSHICDDIFGGSGVVPRLPQTFAELPKNFRIELTAPKPPVAEEPTPEPVETPAETPAAPRRRGRSAAVETPAETPAE